MNATTFLWDRFQKYSLFYPDIGVALDISRMRSADDFFDKMKPRVERAFHEMAELEVRKDRFAPPVEVEEGITSGDYLHGFLRGTRAALYEKGRESITISIWEVNAFQIGSLIALYERAVGFYGSLVNINAYHQPGVEAGKKAATQLLELQQRLRKALPKSPVKPPGKWQARSVPIRKMSITSCVISRQMIPPWGALPPTSHHWNDFFFANVIST